MDLIIAIATVALELTWTAFPIMMTIITIALIIDTTVNMMVIYGKAPRFTARYNSVFKNSEV